MNRRSAAISRFDAWRREAWPALGPRLPRGDGVAEVHFEERNGRTQLLHLYQRTPCRVLFPRTHRGELISAVLLTTSGGLTGGDRVRVDVALHQNARARVTSQAAEKIYRSSGEPCTIDIHIRADVGSWIEWMPQETILFDRCRLKRSTTIVASPGAEVVAGEVVVLGRLAHGEALTRCSVHDTWTVTYRGRPTWVDRMALDGPLEECLDQAAGFDGAKAVATFVYVADEACARISTARKLLAGCSVRCGVTGINNVLITRFLARNPHALRLEYMGFWSAFRAQVGSLPARVPRVWEC